VLRDSSERTIVLACGAACRHPPTSAHGERSSSGSSSSGRGGTMPAAAAGGSGWPDISVPGFRSAGNSGGGDGGFNTDEMCSMCPTLSYQQRMIGFVVCMVVGYILAFMGTLLLISGSIGLFAALYVIGNIISLGGTSFLIGPKSHCKKMFHPSRRYAAIAYLSLLLATFIAAVAGAFVVIVLMLLVLQLMAAVW
jgi:Got1/Sft2-like family